MANGWGGARPGSGGNKKLVVVERQESNRDVVLRQAEEPSPLNPSRTLWEDVVHAMLMEALKGNVIAFGQLLPYIAGGKPTAPTVIQAEGQFNIFHWPAWLPDPAVTTGTIEGTATELPQLADGEHCD